MILQEKLNYLMYESMRNTLYLINYCKDGHIEMLSICICYYIIVAIKLTHYYHLIKIVFELFIVQIIYYIIKYKFNV